MNSDTITTTILKQWDIPAYDLGNPMMDSLDPTGKLTLPPEATTGDVESRHSPLKVLLLPGSRAPENHRNWTLILQAVKSVQAAFENHTLVFLAAIAPSLDLTPFVEALGDAWIPTEKKAAAKKSIGTKDPLDFRSSTQPTSFLTMGQRIFNDSLHEADVAIALAGTATEQFVGLGKPAITLPGDGPQFTPAFAEAQTRLLGPSIIPVQSADEVGEAIAKTLANEKQLDLIRRNGHHRMGQPGAAARIADCLMTVFNA